MGESMHADPVAIKKSIRTYMTIGAALLVFTVITVAANLVHLPIAAAITVALIIAAAKASMVAAVFMHLSHEKQWIYGSLILTVVFFVVLMLLPIFTTMDTIGRPTGAAHRALAPEPAAGQPEAGHEGH
jgi:cytochrome c oxidase subunit 4